MGVLHQTYFLLRKNFQVKRRHKRLTMQEIIVPIYWLLILLVIRLTVKLTPKPDITSSAIPHYSLFNQSVRGTARNGNNNSTNAIIGVVTNNDPQANEIFMQIKNVTSERTLYIEFNSTGQMVNFYKENGGKMPFGLGIVFEKDKNGDMSYILHFKKGIIPDLKDKIVDKGKCYDMNNPFNPYYCPANQYISSSIASLQAVIDSAIIKVLSGLPFYIVPDITVQMMPKRSFTPTVGGFETTVPIYLVLGFAPYITILLVNLVDEKEKKHKELLRIMGMQDSAYWLSWFLTYAIILFIAVIIINVIAVPSGILGNSNFVVMVIIFYLFGLSLVTFAFMLTPLFKKSMTAGTVANLLTAVMGILIIPLNLPNVPSYVKGIMSIFSPTAFALCITEAVRDTGLHFNNLSSKGSFPVSYAIIMIVFDIFFYLAMALYLDAVMPAEYGRRRPPYFIFLPSFWKSLFFDDTKHKHKISRQMSAKETENQMEDVEPVGQEMLGKEAISIHKLRKVFPGKEEVVAIDGISMDIYQGQVTALLGHNGAGKSTLMAVLTGMLTPTSGTALIYGMDVSDPDQMTQIRKNIGVCPQQDVVFDFLTVEEHLDLYAGLKGIPSDARKTMVASVVKDIDLGDKKHEIAKNLSGGQKRKLCVGIALIGNPKVLFLDEPTSGMDPFSRRSMWSLLEEQAKDKVVLLTTHFMDEADILADYKAIMSKGKLRCAGTSLFLKNRFGIGYHLTMALLDGCDTDALTSLVKSHVEGAQLIRHHGRELAFSLPMEQVGNFANLFAAFEENNAGDEGCAAAHVGVSSYGVSMTTLEEVFLQLEDTSETDKAEENDEGSETEFDTGSQPHLVVSQPKTTAPQASNLHHTGVELTTQDTLKASAKPTFKAQMLGRLRIQWLVSIRSPAKIFFMIFLPPIFLVIGLVLMKVNSSSITKDLTRVAISPAMYITPGSTENYASALLFQNSTGSSVDNVYGFLKDFSVNVEQVKSLQDYLDISTAQKPGHSLGLDVKVFPTATNMSANPNLVSRFMLRYNDTTVHSIPVGVNLVTSLFNMFALKAQGKQPHPIKTFFQQLPLLKPEFKFDNNAFVSILLIGMSFLVIPGPFAIAVVYQKQLNIRHLLRVSGLSTFIYWLSFFISDALVFFIPAMLMVILILAIGVVSLSSAAAIGCLIIAVMLYIPSNILFAYCLSFLFDKWETCQSVLSPVYVYLGLIPFIAVSLVDMIANPDTAIIMHYVFSFVDPVYGIIGAMYYINRVYLFATLKAQSDDVIIPASEYFSWTKYNGIPVVFLAMFLHSVIFGCLLYYLDTRNSGRKFRPPCVPFGNKKIDRRPSSTRTTSPTSLGSVDMEDEDVIEEKSNLLAMDLGVKADNNFSVAVKGLFKRFGKKKKKNVVVKDLYFGVQRGEVFGLLGPNGAGKTTTLNIVTGAIAPTRGQVTVAGFDMSTHAQDIFRRMGYCPQHDALWDTITLEEHLIVYARVSGVPWEDVDSTVRNFMSAMRVTEHAHKKAKDLSGGTKRKLSFLIAMLGGPELLLLDEPSTGLDPSARRFLWNTISKNVRGDRGAILTTHSMEEADALSSRVGIMVKGQLKCLGSTQHLKSKYGSGYSLEIKLERSDTDAQSKLEEFVQQLFPGAILNETFGGKSTYKVPKESVTRLSTVFSMLEQGKQTVGIEEYSFSQSTLEQVFLEFAREQDDDRTGNKDKTQEKLENDAELV